MTARLSKVPEGPDTPPETGDAPGPERRSAVLRWQTAPVDAESVCLGPMPGVLATLIGNLGCRVLCGMTEDLTAMVVRVYSEDQSLALFPRNMQDWQDIKEWAEGPTVLDDIRQYGEVVSTERPRRRRTR